MQIAAIVAPYRVEGGVKTGSKVADVPHPPEEVRNFPVRSAKAKYTEENKQDWSHKNGELNEFLIRGGNV